jgi:uncharacterized iron-regulated protein
MRALQSPLYALSLGLITLVGCSSVGTPPVLSFVGGHSSIVDSHQNRGVSFDAMVEELATADVVFLGELHDSSDTHRLQARTTRALSDRRAIAVSLEMFERDAQDLVDLYLGGGHDEATFLAHSRPWPNYDPDYRPVIELARERGLPVVAGNCYRPLASRVAKEGLAAAVGDPWAAMHAQAGPGAYHDKFMGAMGGMGAHGGGMAERMELIFQAQCIKDEAMAEGIIDALAKHDGIQVVHWCGRFHSDFGLGTVERVLRRDPTLKVRIVSAVRGSGTPPRVQPEDVGRADYLWYVRN